MEVRIGVAHAPREVVLESAESTDAVLTAVSAAIAKGTVLDLVDEKGRHVVVPGAQIAFVEVGDSTKGKVGFHA